MEINEEMLKFLLKKANISSIDEVSNRYEFMTNKQILAEHPYAITTNKDGRFSTYVPDESKSSKRRKIVKPTRELLEKEIVRFYKDKEKAKSRERMCLRKLYPQWLDYKSLHTDSSAYIRTIDILWKRYYENDSIIDTPIVELTKHELDIWAHSVVRKNNLTKKQYYNMTIIIRQSLDMAVEMGIINENPFQKVKMESKLFKPVKKKSDETQVFLTDEKILVEKAAYADFEESNETACLAIPFLFQTGLRISEIVALKWSDIDEENENYIHIQRMETKEFDRLADGAWSYPRRVVIERTKSDAGNRNVYLTTVARKILNQIRECNLQKGYTNDGYIFLNAKGRISTLCIDTRIRKYCRHISIDEKGSHKARKTYISTLIDSGEININYIREMVGHTDERTTYGNYCFNRKPKDKTAMDMENALVCNET